MAQKVTVALEDDLDGSPADETVRFGLDGAECEIDLSEKNARLPRAARAVEHGRKAGRGSDRRLRLKPPSASSSDQPLTPVATC
jgi:hypothetical protein